ncbi:MAG TPA: DUF6492 family protein [Chlamydiales bacterium]|nr:DUF6492 family protein [Chlamydiales bacterium]
MRFLLACLLLVSSLHAKWEKVTYPLTTDPIDVVIPCSPKDLETLELCIDGIKQYGANLRRIIVVSKEKLTDKAEWFDEAKFPFDKEQVALEIFGGDAVAAQEFIDHPKTRIGWIYQQLLKFYTPFVIPDISPNVLILDSDVIFIKPVSFMGEQGEPLFASSREYTQEYMDHANRLLPDFKRVHPARSGVAHHMLFQKPILEDLLQVIKKRHQAEPWKAILRCIDRNVLYASSMSEYEIYFNFAFLRTTQATLRPLRSINIVALRLFSIYSKHHYDFITCHSWARDLPFTFMLYEDGR